MKTRIEKVVVERIPDECPALDFLQHEYDEKTRTIIKSGAGYSQESIEGEGWETIKRYMDEDTKRLREHGVTWWMYGIRASAEIVVCPPEWNGTGVCETIRSGALWGIESDSEVSYMHGVGEEELSQLGDILRALGFSAEDVQAAIAKAEWQF